MFRCDWNLQSAVAVFSDLQHICTVHLLLGEKPQASTLSEIYIRSGKSQTLKVLNRSIRLFTFLRKWAEEIMTLSVFSEVSFLSRSVAGEEKDLLHGLANLYTQFLSPRLHFKVQSFYSFFSKIHKTWLGGGVLAIHLKQTFYWHLWYFSSHYWGWL